MLNWNISVFVESTSQCVNIFVQKLMSTFLYILQGLSLWLVCSFVRLIIDKKSFVHSIISKSICKTLQLPLTALNSRMRLQLCSLKADLCQLYTELYQYVTLMNISDLSTGVCFTLHFSPNRQWDAVDFNATALSYFLCLDSHSWLYKEWCMNTMYLAGVNKSWTTDTYIENIYS